MTVEKLVLGRGSQFSGQLTADGDLHVEGKLSGDRLRVTGCLIVAAGAEVICQDTQVGEAQVLGVFRGTLRSSGTVGLIATGRVIGDIVAARVVFKESLSAESPPETPRAVASPSPSEPVQARPSAPPPPEAPRAAVQPPVSRPDRPAPLVEKREATVSSPVPAAPVAPSAAERGRAALRGVAGSSAVPPPPVVPLSAAALAPPPVSRTAVDVVPRPAPLVPAEQVSPPRPPVERMIPALPTLGQRTMRKSVGRE